MSRASVHSPRRDRQRAAASDPCPGVRAGVHVGRLLRAVEQGVALVDIEERFGIQHPKIAEIVAYHRRQQPA